MSARVINKPGRLGAATRAFTAAGEARAEYSERPMVAFYAIIIDAEERVGDASMTKAIRLRRCRLSVIGDG